GQLQRSAGKQAVGKQQNGENDDPQQVGPQQTAMQSIGVNRRDSFKCAEQRLEDFLRSEPVESVKVSGLLRRRFPYGIENYTQYKGDSAEHEYGIKPVPNLKGRVYRLIHNGGYGRM